MTRRAARGEVGLLRIGHCSAALNDVLPNAIRKLKERFPAVGVQLRELGWVEQLELLARGEIDVGFTYREAIDQRSFMTLDMHECGFVVALPAGHILANLHRVSIERLANEPYVAIAAKFNACAHINVQMLGENMSAPAFEVDDKLSALGLVANGLGFTIIPEIAVIPYPNVAFRSLDTLQSIHLAGIWTHEAGTLIRQHFIDALRPLAAASNLETAQSTPL